MSTTNYILLQLNYLYSLFHNENKFKNIFEKGVVTVVTVVTVVFKGFFRIFLPHFTTFTTLQITQKRT